ncbi:DUF3888 domain-containing protein [Paenibacillus sp. HN-1]|uniref:DUF3888 domain-containing protein n=1 Tax=Paenibacillus TaxID=44249 RepID=UPI001CA81F90|nr:MULTISPECIES: DUF3888 domain-containing protein [Paenibacillus]MBY9078364.1 DUF3888 domain-containing protein [Paenibacillus sp. CGMCC 1.18879]MBY9087303.1 DUF3888 domain-containing protein [Paenibacillus sinensis]
MSELRICTIIAVSLAAALLLGDPAAAAWQPEASSPIWEATGGKRLPEDHGTRLMLTLLYPHIQAELKRCYKDTKHPEVQFAPFLPGTSIVKMEYESSGIDLTLLVHPYVGPHLTVGEDELDFRIDNTGQVTALGCRHLRDYPLPWNYAGSPGNGWATVCGLVP